MSEFVSDVTIVGGGIAGLWTAKELLDRGYGVNLVEKSGSLAAGATTRNEGWLHAGTYHAVAIDNEADASQVTARTIYGHDEIVRFAPESIDHQTSYAFIRDDELAQRALYRWGRLGVEFREMPYRHFSAEGFDTDRISAAFAVKDKSVNSVVLCKKLTEYIFEHGGRIFLDASYHPVDDGVAEMSIGDDRHILRSEATIVSAGAGTKDIFQEVTGKPFPMRYFKSHLLVAPRLSNDNFFYVDPMEAGIMSHGNGTIIGINREASEETDAMCGVDSRKVALLRHALGEMLPSTRQLDASHFSPVACVKADVVESSAYQAGPVVQDLNIKVLEPAPNYICAIPGKMTEAPALGRAAADFIETGRGVTVERRSAPNVSFIGESAFPITSRPLDIWLSERPEQEEAS